MGKLSDNNYILTLMTALVKHAGGEIRLSESTLLSVTKQDVVTLFYDDDAGEVVLQVADSVFTMNPPDDGYKN